MPTPAFFAVLRDVTKLAASVADDLAAQSVKLAAAADDVAVLTGKAAAKTAGVAGDDLAVGAGQMGGMSPSRELPAIWRIAKASTFNKLWLSALLLLVSALWPAAVTIALVIGGLYLAYEGGESLLEKFHPHGLTGEPTVLSEDEKVRGAIRTDLVLSLEILIIALAATGDVPLAVKATVLLGVAALMTAAVYGVIALLIRLDDIGLAMARSGGALRRRIGKRLVVATPVILRLLDPLGMFAMLAVAGGIFMHLLPHVSFPHWSVGLAADVILAAIIGTTLAAGRALVGYFRTALA